jgi:P pilus assembly chaperone PapD
MNSTLINRTAIKLLYWSLPLSLLWGGAAKAQVGLAPLVIQTEAKNGQAQAFINVKNNGNEPFRARVYVEPFTYTKDEGFQTLPSSPSDISKYLQYSPRELNIPAGTERKVRLIVRFPPSLPDGEYRAVIFTENLKPSTSTNGEGFTTEVTGRVGSTFFVRKGNVQPNFVVDSATWNSKRKQIQILVRNTGKASAYITTNWTLKQGDQVIRKGSIPALGFVPESERNVFVLDYPDKKQADLPTGNYQLTGEVTWGEENKKSKVPFSLNLTIPTK